MKKFVFIIIIFLIIIFFFLFFVFQKFFLPTNPESLETVNFSIEKGEGIKEISKRLRGENIIKSDLLFILYNIYNGTGSKIQAGEYYLSPSMSFNEIIAILIKGDVVKEKITIIEGWNLDEIAFYLEEKGISSYEDFFKEINNFENEFNFLKDKPIELNIEGYLFPDTYEILPSFSLKEIITRMLNNFDRKLTLQMREDIISQNKTIFEIITMASLIEKEVRTTEDKKIVSGLLWKRINVNMPLQVDATIVYLTGKRSTKVSLEELKINSPYNTYMYRGLPLGPICNPGIESIKAAIYPKESDYWFYLSTPKGETIFSRNLEEHNVAKQKYLR